jgi:predicted Zn-dependent peptidase
MLGVRITPLLKFHYNTVILLHMENKVIISKAKRHFYEKQQLPMAAFDIVFHTGSAYEDKLVDSSGKKIINGDRGLHHLLEHLSCYLYKDMLTELKENGIYSNAYTCEDTIVFTFSGLDSRLTPDIKLRLFNKITGNYNIEEERFQNERKTVIEEYNDAFDDPISGTLNNFYRKKLNCAGVIGVKDDILRATNDSMKRMHDLYIKHPYSIIEIGPTKTKEFDNIKYSDHVSSLILSYGDYDVPLEKVNSDKSNIVGIAKRTFTQDDSKFICVINKMLGSGLESPFYKEIRENRGLSYFQYLSDMTIDNLGTCITLASTSKEREKELLDLYHNLFSDVTKYMTKERFDSIMKYISVNEEERKVLRYENYDDILSDGLIYIDKDSDKVVYDEVVNFAKSYYNNDNFTFENFGGLK